MGSSNPCGAKQSRGRTPAPAANQHQSQLETGFKPKQSPFPKACVGPGWCSLNLQGQTCGCHPCVLTSWAAQWGRTPRAWA